MIEQAIIQTLHVSRKGERIYFQMRLPHDTHRVIGFEYGARKINESGANSRRIAPDFDWEEYLGFKFVQNKVIGKLSLQIQGCEAMFFQSDLIEDRNIAQHEGISALSFQPYQWTHCSKREELSFSGIKSNTNIIEGVFEDRYSENEFVTLEYWLNIYLWIEKCKK